MADLTQKERAHLGQLHAKFLAGTFSETDVHAAIVLLRFQVGKGDVRELGNSIVHAERDRGKFFDRIRANQDALNNLGKKDGMVHASPIVTANTFAANLNEGLAKFKLAELPLTRCDVVLLCGLSLVQGGSMKAKEGAAHVGDIALALSAEHVQLQATTPIKHEKRNVRATFQIASVPNQWIPICNPRATLNPVGVVSVDVKDGVPTINGFAPFMAQIERAPPIGEDDIAKLVAARPNIKRTDTGIEFVSSAGERMPLRYDGSRLIIEGLPKYFQAASEFAAALNDMRRILGACVHDDSNAHWFLEGLEIAPDGFHSHWVGKGSATCTRPI